MKNETQDYTKLWLNNIMQIKDYPNVMDVMKYYY